MHRNFCKENQKSKNHALVVYFMERMNSNFSNRRKCILAQLLRCFYFLLRKSRHCFRSLLSSLFSSFRSPPKRKKNFAINFSLCDHITQSSTFIHFQFQIRCQSSPVRYPNQGRQFCPGCPSCRSWSCRRRCCQHHRCSVSRFQRAADEVKLVKLNSTSWLRSPRYIHL